MSDVVLTEAPLWMQANQYPARIDRTLIDAIWTEGVITGLLMSPRAAGANLSVDVSAGIAIIQGDDQTNQGKYLARLALTTNVITVAPPTGASQKRIDVLTVVIADPDAGGPAGSNAALHWVQGTPTTGTPAVPAVPSNAVPIGHVTLINGQTSVVAGDISTAARLPAAGRGAPSVICTSSTRPAGALVATTIYETDTQRRYVWTGTAWRYLDGGDDPTAARAYATAGTSIGGTMTVVALAGESYDYGSNFAANTYTVPRAGLLVVQVCISFGFPAAAQRFLAGIHVNGVEVSRGWDESSPGTNPIGGAWSDMLAVAAGDAVTFRAQVPTGSPVACSAGTALTFMACRMLP